MGYRYAFLRISVRGLRTDRYDRSARWGEEESYFELIPTSPGDPRYSVPTSPVTVGVIGCDGGYVHLSKRHLAEAQVKIEQYRAEREIAEAQAQAGAKLVHNF